MKITQTAPTASSRPSMRHAINAHCRDCIYDPLSKGAWREQVASCSASNCALFALRPLPRGCDNPAALAAVRAKCAR